MQKQSCASCGYPRPKMRRFQWALKALGRRTQGTGRQRYLKVVQRKARSGFLTGKTTTTKKMGADKMEE